MFVINKNAKNNESKNVLSKQEKIKQQLIEYIYETITLRNFDYEILKVKSNLELLVQNKFFASVNFHGSSCLLVFVKINNCYYSYLIDRNTLSYNYKKTVLENVKITNVNIKLTSDIYDGTIFDGIYSFVGKTFIITDTYFFKGEDFTGIEMEKKISVITNYLSESCNKNSDDDLVLAINEIYPLNKTEHIIKSVIPKLSSNIKVKGLTFFPEKSGKKLLFMFENEKYKNNDVSITTKTENLIDRDKSLIDSSKQDDKYVEGMQIDSDDMLLFEPKFDKNKSIYIPKKNTKDKKYVFQMVKTKDVDVYVLNIVDSVKKDGKNKLKKIKVCLAYIPNTEKSQWCNDLFSSQNNLSNNGILVNCKYHTNKNKWEPISIDENAKKPSYVSDFDII